MTTLIKTIAVTFTLAALMAGPASAASKFSGDVSQDVLAAEKADTNVTFSVEDNVATVTGYVRDELDRDVAIRAAMSNANIDKVIDLTELPK